jgi:Family of unknown function (DUF6186)
VSSHAVTLAGFAVIGTLLVLWAAYTQVRPHRLTLGRAAAIVTRSRTGKVTACLVWAWLGVHLFARGSAGH